MIFSEAETTYISKIPPKTKKSRWRIRCQEETDLTTVKWLWILQAKSLAAKQPMISSQVGWVHIGCTLPQTHKPVFFVCLFFTNAYPFTSVILERGNKLRNAMVVSALKCDVDSSAALKDTPLPLPKDNILPLSKLVLQRFVKKTKTKKHVIILTL